MKYKNLIFLGTSHIAKQSLNEVSDYIEKEKPDIIAIELDNKRLPALMSQARRKASLGSIRQIGLKGFVFSLIGEWAERKLGKLVGVSPGAEMKQAVKTARKNSIRIALVDQDIELTLQRLSRMITWKEKLNFLIDIIKAMFAGNKDIEFDLTKVPSRRIIKKMVAQLKERYPNVYKVLIEERNEVIANNIKRLVDADSDKKILVILGAGHVDDVLEMIKKAKEPKITFSFNVG